MSLRQITRAAMCAVLVALCIAGAGWFSMRIVAGREATPAALHGATALERLKQDGQYESLQAAVSAARLSVTRVAQTPLGRAAWHAPNRAAGYDAYVTESGVSLALDRETKVSLHLHSLGYGDALRTVGSGAVSGDGQSITIERENIREWFVNGANGLEHGFTLNEAPRSRRNAAPLRLALQVGAGWRATAHADGQHVTLRNDHGQTIDYGKLSVRDAKWRAIPGKLTVANEQVVIEVADQDAAYPLTIDPLFTRGQTLLAEDPLPEAYLGQSVALVGDTALVGAPGDNGARGAAYVFVRSGTTSNAVWAIQTKLLAFDGAAGDAFGTSVALSGDTALVGAPDGPGPVGGNQGVAYVFTRNGTAWTQQRKLFANDGQNDVKFGTAVALDGDTALVGAPFQPTAGVTTGAAYIFTRNGTTWTQQPRLNANDAATGDQFGAAVALDGDMALIGAPKNTVTFANQGAAYAFTRNGADWVFQQRITASSQSAAGDNFGNAVALSGDQAAIGANLKGSDDRGKVFTFRRGATGWGTTSSFEMPVPVAGAHFGTALALRGNTMVVGAALGPIEAGADHRSAYIYTLNGQTWVSVKQLGVGLGTPDDHFGYAVALDGNTVLVGVPFADAATNNQGAVYTFVSLDSRHVEQQKLTAIDGAASDEFGNAVALDGDTVAVGVARDDLSKGAVYVFVRNGTGSNAGWTLQEKIIAGDGTMRDAFGTAVSLSRDTLAVGAPGATVSQKLEAGAVYIFVRNAARWALQQKIAPGLREFSHFGAAVAISGEAMVVGVPDFTTVGGTSRGGYAAIYLHTNLGWFKQGPDLVAATDVLGNKFGAAVALDGNTAVIGAPFDKVGLNDGQGAAYVFTRGTAAWSLQKILVAADGATGDDFGRSVAVSGDTAAVGAPLAKISLQAGQGAAYYFTRSGTTWVTDQKLFNSAGSGGYQFGSAVGLSDTLLAVGEQYGDGSAGVVHVYTRLGVNMEFQQRLNGRPQVDNVFFGNAVAVSGDTIAVGAYYDDIGVNRNQGSAYIFAAPGCPALTLTPASLPNGAVGTTYNQQLTVNGGTGERNFLLAGGSLPPGLTLTSTGLLQGTPTAAGTYRFTPATTSFLNLCSASRSYTLTITENCSALTLSPASLPDGAVGAAYNQQLTVTGGTAPYSFAVTAGALPGGLALSGTGAISGTPTISGPFNFIVTATDANGCTGSRSYSLTISNGGGTTGLQFYPLAHPVRLLDTRAGQSGCFTPGAPIAAGTSRTQPARGVCDGLTIPA
ncbi:MAG TPA: putative Ig domain-containing protein, partial [Blastocatellia bacterium]|nr:putative Ig domain-containing protein [Blastocatellia bacterium]HMZ21300.1 putative Ig domain-containing protein [Blastocatellia bacterium]